MWGLAGWALQQRKVDSSYGVVMLMYNKLVLNVYMKPINLKFTWKGANIKKNCYSSVCYDAYTQLSHMEMLP